ncbi:MAG TPA: response regulator [Thermoanaerobaculia bacterium]|nr:response regulator [Thermoanaerobaculia bacterium]
MKVLIIDDEADLRSLAHVALEGAGMEVIEASSGPEGFAAARVHRPDAILLDAMLPGFDGPSTLSLLRTDETTAAIPVIFLTANALPSEIDRLRGLGARGVITKPFAPMRLAAETAALLDVAELVTGGRTTHQWKSGKNG